MQLLSAPAGSRSDSQCSDLTELIIGHAEDMQSNKFSCVSLCDVFHLTTKKLDNLPSPLFVCLLCVSQVWKEVQSWDSGHTGLRAAVEGKHRHASTVEVCVCKTELYVGASLTGSWPWPLPLSRSLSRYDPSLWWYCHQCWFPPHRRWHSDLYTSVHTSIPSWTRPPPCLCPPFTTMSRHIYSAPAP